MIITTILLSCFCHHLSMRFSINLDYVFVLDFFVFVLQGNVLAFSDEREHCPAGTSLLCCALS